FLIIIITVGLILSACGTEQSASNTNNDQAETDNQANNEIDEDEAFDVHGVKLNVKEEPEDIIEEEYDNDTREKGIEKTYNLKDNKTKTDKKANNEIDEDEEFDVHGVKLNVKEEPEDIIEAEYDNDPRDKGVDTTFTLTDERKEEIIKAIIEQDEETFRKHNY